MRESLFKLYRVTLAANGTPTTPWWVVVEALTPEGAADRVRKTYRGCEIKAIDLCENYAILPMDERTRGELEAEAHRLGIT